MLTIVAISALFLAACGTTDAPATATPATPATTQSEERKSPAATKSSEEE